MKTRRRHGWNWAANPGTNLELVRGTFAMLWGNRSFAMIYHWIWIASNEFFLKMERPNHLMLHECCFASASSFWLLSFTYWRVGKGVDNWSKVTIVYLFRRSAVGPLIWKPRSNLSISLCILRQALADIVTTKISPTYLWKIWRNEF